MNTQFLYISNIPSNCKPVLLLHELKNKWARMLYLENTFSGLRDAFVYNPAESFEQFCAGVQNLRNKEIDGVKPLSVFYVWFPPINVFITTMIPAGASMLSYLFVENLHKDVNPTEVIYDLPLQGSDVKNWDIPERPDKCVIVKMPLNCNSAMRSFIIGTLRSRPVRGQQVRVSELIISEQSQLSTQMVPRSVKINETKEESYLSNFLYLHDIPANVTAKMIVDIAKTDSIRGSRVFFMEIHNNMKYGFLYVPRSLPNARFTALYEKIKSTNFQISDIEVATLKIDKSWFQPHGAVAPYLQDGIPDCEFILTEYLYLSGVPSEVIATQLSLGSPFPIKLYLFTVNEVSTQIGFVVLRGLGEFQVVMVANYLRNINFNGVHIQVDEVYLECDSSLQTDISQRPFQLQPRKRTMITPKTAVKRVYSEDESYDNGFVKKEIVLTTLADEDMSLMKSEFICVDNLPKNVSKAALIFDIGRVSDGCIVIPRNGYSTAFLYYPDCDIATWTDIISRLSLKNFGVSRKTAVHEVYLKSDLTNDDNSQSPLTESGVIFVYNIAPDVTVDEVSQLAIPMVDYAELLETTSGSKSAFLALAPSCSKQATCTLLQNIRKQFLRGKPIYADLVSLASVTETKTPRSLTLNHSNNFIKRPRFYQS